MWLLPLTCAPLKSQRFTARPASSSQFQRQTGTFRFHRPVVFFLSLQCYTNQQTQQTRPNIPFLHSTLLHVSAVHRLATVHTKNKKLDVSPNKQGCKLVTVTTVIPYKMSNYMKECVRNFPGTMQCIESNTKLQCNIK